jgi:hypothetical protein
VLELRRRAEKEASTASSNRWVRGGGTREMEGGVHAGVRGSRQRGPA